MNINLEKIPTPCYICDEDKLKANLSILERVQREAECEIILALKGFAMFGVFSFLRETLKGTAASSLNEARLGSEEFGGKVHLCAPAYREDKFDELLNLSDYIVFNSFSQWKRFRGKVAESGHGVKAGIRINPEYSEVEAKIYDPCAVHSRLGVTREEFEKESLEGITGLHFHTHCANNPDTLERTLEVIEKNFGDVVEKMEWVNFGGGHHITRRDYDVDRLIRLVKDFGDKYGVNVILEPGEAVALNAGVLVASVLDIIRNRIDIAILDTSASAHMPDVIEMPYRPGIIGASIPGAHPHHYRLTGSTCLAGDVIGDYSFPKPLEVGTKLVFTDMLHYTMVKNNTFNGINLPSIAVWSEKDGLKILKEFAYQDYRSRLS